MSERGRGKVPREDAKRGNRERIEEKRPVGGRDAIYQEANVEVAMERNFTIS